MAPAFPSTVAAENKPFVYYIFGFVLSTTYKGDAVSIATSQITLLMQRCYNTATLSRFELSKSLTVPLGQLWRLQRPGRISDQELLEQVCKCRYLKGRKVKDQLEYYNIGPYEAENKPYKSKRSESERPPGWKGWKLRLTK